MLRERMDPALFITGDETPRPILVHIHLDGELCKVSGVKFVIAGVSKGFVFARSVRVKEVLDSVLSW